MLEWLHLLGWAPPTRSGIEARRAMIEPQPPNPLLVVCPICDATLDNVAGFDLATLHTYMFCIPPIDTLPNVRNAAVGPLSAKRATGP